MGPKDFVYLYFIVSASLTFFMIGRERCQFPFQSWEDKFGTSATIIMLISCMPWLWVAEGVKLSYNWFLSVSQVKFYWIYLRGGFYNVDEGRLVGIDRAIFKIDCADNPKLKHLHLKLTFKLILKRNRYVRKNWKVIEGLVEQA